MDVWTHAVGRMPYRFDRFPRTKEHCLNGVWDFALIPRADADTQTPEQLGALPKPKAISVPGCWQLQGFDKPKYINTRYAFGQMRTSWSRLLFRKDRGWLASTGKI